MPVKNARTDMADYVLAFDVEVANATDMDVVILLTYKTRNLVKNKDEKRNSKFKKIIEI